MKQPPLLPSDIYLASLLGLSEEEYRWFRREVEANVKIEPGKPQAGLETLAIISIVATVISVGLTIAASFFKPRSNSSKPAQLKTSNNEGDTIVSVERYAPLAGFDSVQKVVGLGTTIPLIYANKQNQYGGVRVTMPLIWSQLRSARASQLLRSIYMLGEGEIDSIDPLGFAIGNNGLGFYELDGPAAQNARFSIYFRKNGGRIAGSDLIAGRPASTDIGAFSASDVYEVNTGKHFCMTGKPSTQTTFGVYTLIGNNLAYRVNPAVRPAVQAQLIPKGEEGDAKVKCDFDKVALAMRQKYKAVFSCRSGLIGGSVGSVGSTINYRLDNTSDAETEFFAGDSSGTWQTREEVDYNPFVFQNYESVVTSGIIGEVVSDDQLRDLTQTTILSVTTTQIVVSCVFFAATAGPIFAKAEEGTYLVRMNCIAYNEGLDIEIRCDFNFEVRVDKATDLSLATTTTSIDPTFVLNTSSSSVGGVPTTSTSLVKTSDGAVTVTGTVSSTNSYSVRVNRPIQTFTKPINSNSAQKERAKDAAAAISGRQKTWDDAIIVGELYKIGSALAVCTDRSANAFQSEADFTPTGGGAAVDATFTTIRAGTANTFPLADLIAKAQTLGQGPARTNATNGTHLYRIAIADVTTTRECSVVQIGFKSTLGLRVNGSCNYKDTLTFQEADEKACLSKRGKTISKGDTLKVDIYNSGTITASEEHYSFFRVSFREANNDAAFTTLSPVFGIAGITQQTSFNMMRFNMPSVKRWEFRFEPVTGWEIRSGTVSGTLYILDSKVTPSEIDISTSGLGVSFAGRSIARAKDSFALNTTRRTTDIGTGIFDEDNYADAWGRLAESFIFEEIGGTTDSGPEHEIVFMSETVPNATVPQYDNMAIVGLNIRASFEWQQLSQFSAYVLGGRKVRRLLQSGSEGPSSLFPDILRDIMLSKRFGTGESISEEQLDLDSFRTAAQWCQTRNYYFDGVVVERINLRQWAADTAATMLLDFVQRDGKFGLEPAVVFGSAVPIKGLFTAGNIVENSFQLEFLDEEDRLPIQVSVKWRKERASTSLTTKASFAEEREVLVREASRPDTDPVESFDLSSYCTNERHAIDVACHVIRMRRLITHSIKFQTTPDGILSQIGAGDYIQVAMDFTFYDEFANGVILDDGTLVTTRQDLLPAGTHAAIIWDGSEGPVIQQNIVVAANGKATPTGVIFVKKNVSSQVRTYKIESISIGDQGIIDIEAVHHPTDGSGVSEIGKSWTTYATDSSWIISKS
jgi:hypothetical protein